MLTLLKQGLLLFPCAALCPTASLHQNKRALFNSDWMVGWCCLRSEGSLLLLYRLFLQLKSRDVLCLGSLRRRNSFQWRPMLLSRTDDHILVQLCFHTLWSLRVHGFALPLGVDRCTSTQSCGEIQLLCCGNIFGPRPSLFRAQVGLNSGRIQ